MKKLFLLAAAAFLFTGLSFGQGGDKGKDKGKKTGTTSCPGKHCGKKSAS